MMAAVQESLRFDAHGTSFAFWSATTMSPPLVVLSARRPLLDAVSECCRRKATSR